MLLVWWLQTLRRWLGRDDDGQGLVEYGLIIALISIVCVVAMATLGGEINNKLYGNISSSLTSLP